MTRSNYSLPRESTPSSCGRGHALHHVGNGGLGDNAELTPHSRIVDCCFRDFPGVRAGKSESEKALPHLPQTLHQIELAVDNKGPSPYGSFSSTRFVATIGGCGAAQRDADNRGGECGGAHTASHFRRRNVHLQGGEVPLCSRDDDEGVAVVDTGVVDIIGVSVVLVDASTKYSNRNCRSRHRTAEGFKGVKGRGAVTAPSWHSVCLARFQTHHPTPPNAIPACRRRGPARRSL